MNTSEVSQLLMARAQELASHVVTCVWGRIPGYDADHMRRQDFDDYIMPKLLSVLVSVRDGTPADVRLTSISSQRALQGVPVEAVMKVWRIAEHVILDEFLAFSKELAADELRKGTARIGVVFDQLVDASVAAYRKTQEEVTERYEHLATDLVAHLAAPGPVDTEKVVEEAHLLGANPYDPYQAIALAFSSSGPHRMEAIQRRVLAEVSGSIRGRILVGTRKNGAMILVPNRDQPSTLVPIVERALMDPLIGETPIAGFGEISERLIDIQTSCYQAGAALEVGFLLGNAGRVIVFSEVLPEMLLLHNENLTPLLFHNTLGALVQKPHLLETLRCYLSCGLSVRATARELLLHPNTVAYRLQRISELMGRKLDNVVDLLDVLLALRALNLVQPELLDRGLGWPKNPPKTHTG